MKYHVTYYYLATGMEGIADQADYGIIEAESEEEAEHKIALREMPIDELYGPDNTWSSRDFFEGCLIAREVK